MKKEPDNKRGLWGYVLLITGFIACPCHIPLWIPLIAGTAFGAALAQNQGWVILGAGPYFAFALWMGWRMIERRGSES